MATSYTVVLLKEEVGGYSVLVPALPGCCTQGETVPEALDMAKGAILCHIRSLEKHHEPVPEDLGTVVFDWGDSQEALAYRVRVPLREVALAA